MTPLARAREHSARPLIAAHRGTPIGSVYPNTLAAAQAAFASGADIVELDVLANAEGSYFAFHDGYEQMLLGSEVGIEHLSDAEVADLRYGKVLGGSGVAGVDHYFEIVSELGERFVNVDRSWRYWGDGFLQELAATGYHDYRIVKSPVDAEHLDQLAAAKTPFPYLAMVKSGSDIEQVRARSDINLIGLEILPRGADDLLASRDYLQSLRDAGLLLWLNALNLENLVPLFLGFDDEVSVLDNPERGWGVLVDYGADIIQTDWPWLLRHYLDRR